MTILLCTEENVLLTSLEYRFRKAGWRLELAHDFEQAAQKCRKEAPSLVVVDLRLPEGLDIVQYIHQEIDAQLPILIAAPLDDKKLLLEGLRLGGQDFIVAPYMPDELTLRIRCLLQRQKVAG